jgi:preprotein translocase subunit YajC
VNTIFWNGWICISQAAGGEAAASPGGGIIQLLTLIIPIGVIFYFLLIRPQRKEQARRQEMLGGVKKNDRIATIGGIYGIVTNVQKDTDELTLKVDEANNTKIRISLSAVGRIITDDE